jgi:RimJ/RimL family protein N-acetyltransferase
MTTQAKHATVFLRGRRVYLRPPHKETDLEFFQRWINDPRVRKFLKQRPPYSMAAEEKWFDGMVDRDDILFTICLLDGTPIGCTGLHKINQLNRTAETGTWLAVPYWGQGYGTDAKMLLLKYAFDTINIRKIVSSAIAFNGRSIGHNQNCGYRIEGRRRRQHFVNGRYHDEVLLACFRAWWEPKWRKYRAAR